MEIAGHMDVYASGALYEGLRGTKTFAYIVVVLCTESVVCGLASHTSRSNSPVTHPSFFPPFRGVIRGLRQGKDECYQLVGRLREVCLGIGQHLCRSNQTRMNHFVRSLIWIHKVVENHQESLVNFPVGFPGELPARFLNELPVRFLDELPAGFLVNVVLTAHCVEIAGHRDVCRRIGDCGAYIVVVLCTESVVCGLASHTSRSNSPVTHPSFFPPFR
ncbi:unnamed protein product [Brassica rapa subsp. trilocularis]